MAKCIIFGGNGFIGSHLAEKLLRQGYEVKIFGSFRNGTSNLSDCINDVEIIKGDYLNSHDVSSALKDVDILFHYISNTNNATKPLNPVFEIETNIIGSVRLLQAALDNYVEKIIYPSSGGTIYGETNGKPVSEDEPKNPVSPYAISKFTIERYLEYFHRNYGMKYSVIRYSNPFGERQNPHGNQGVIPVFLNKILHGESPVIFGDGTAVRDYIYIDDAIDATLAVLESKTKETIFNVGSGDGYSLNQLINIMSEITGRNISPVYTDDSGNNISKIVLDISRISNATGWTPKVSIHDGILKTWNWLKKDY
ncbi:MAG: NAD-dependent epimerase/dehydratase family protein [Methanomicrobiaceae archaeon]|nr:NAD-dependent epimerase/dehydratase family protein [Methanomicrobiaceae archaeon]